MVNLLKNIYNQQVWSKYRFLCVHLETGTFIFHRTLLNVRERVPRERICWGCFAHVTEFGFSDWGQTQSASLNEKLRSTGWRLNGSLYHRFPLTQFVLSVLGTLHTPALMPLFICLLCTVAEPIPAQSHWPEWGFPSSYISDSLDPSGTKL